MALSSEISLPQMLGLKLWPWALNFFWGGVKDDLIPCLHLPRQTLEVQHPTHLILSGFPNSCPLLPDGSADRLAPQRQVTSHFTSHFCMFGVIQVLMDARPHESPLIGLQLLGSERRPQRRPTAHVFNNRSALLIPMLG